MDEGRVEYLAALDADEAWSGCELCGGTGVWTYSLEGGGWAAECCPRCRPARPALSRWERWSAARRALADEALEMSNHRFETLKAYLRGLMASEEWAVYQARYRQVVSDWHARWVGLAAREDE